MTRRASPPKTREEAIDFYGHEKVQQCGQCGGFYDGNSYPGACFACAMGMELYSGPDGPSKRPLEGKR